MSDRPRLAAELRAVVVLTCSGGTPHRVSLESVVSRPTTELPADSPAAVSDSGGRLGSGRRPVEGPGEDAGDSAGAERRSRPDAGGTAGGNGAECGSQAAGDGAPALGVSARELAAGSVLAVAAAGAVRRPGRVLPVPLERAAAAAWKAVPGIRAAPSPAAAKPAAPPPAEVPKALLLLPVQTSVEAAHLTPVQLAKE